MEIPGLVKEAHRGVGLGHEFLRHAERARVYIHLVDGLSDHIQEDMDMINSELFSYGKGLISKPQIVVINKIDIPEVAKRQINIEDTVSCFTDTIIVVKTKDVALAFSALNELFEFVENVQ